MQPSETKAFSKPDDEQEEETWWHRWHFMVYCFGMFSAIPLLTWLIYYLISGAHQITQTHDRT